MEYECEICGKKTRHPYVAYIEGARVILCEECAKKYKNAEPLFKQAERKARLTRRLEKRKKAERKFEIVENYAELVRKARERRGMKIEDLAKSIAEPESEVHKIEKGELVPELKVAQKLEKFLGITLVHEITEEELEKEEETARQYIEKKPGRVTLGDIVVIKKKKKGSTNPSSS